VQEQVNGGDWSTVSTIQALHFNFQLALGSRYNFRVRAVADGATSNWQTGVAFSVVGLQQTTLTYSGKWKTTTNTNLWGGTGKSTKARGGSASTTVTGRTFAIIGNMGPGNGAAKLYVDGVLKQTLNEHAASTSYRNIVGNWAWGVTGTHALKVVNSATSRHPRFDVDGVVVFQ
jgi:hypothetical protein